MSDKIAHVVVASSDRLFRETAASYLERHAGWSVIQASDGVQALAAVGRSGPDAVLVLGELRRLGTEAFTRQVHRRWPDVRVVVLAGPGDDRPATLPAEAPAIAVVAALAERTHVAPRPVADALPEGVRLLGTLTRRETRILRLLSDGSTIKEIAQRLALSENTVRTHMQNLYRKLGIHSRLDVVRFAARHGLLPESSGDHLE
jgi:DNA-binding NarL/FixJ family response regulator